MMLLRLSSSNKKHFYLRLIFPITEINSFWVLKFMSCEFWDFLLLWDQKLFPALCEHQILFHFVFQSFFKPGFRWYLHMNNLYSVENMRVSSLDLCIFIFVPLFPLQYSALWISTDLSSWTPTSISLHEGLETVQAVS